MRLAIGQDGVSPRESPDRYGWPWRYETFADQLAAVMAHELYQHGAPSCAGYRGDDEQAANRWALAHATSRGFRVEAESPVPAA
jgi:hypothetical protein